MEGLPKIVRRQLRSVARPGGHPHADLLTAFTEKLLSERERIRVMEHLSRCDDCREVVFLSTPQQEHVQVVGKIPAAAGWLSWPVLRWGAAVACVVVVGTAVTLFRESQPRSLLSEMPKRESAANLSPHSAPSETLTAAAKRDEPSALMDKVAPANKDSDQDKLGSKLKSPERPNPKAMTASPRLRMQFDQSRQINENAVGTPDDASSSGAVLNAPAAPAPTGGANVRAQGEIDAKQTHAAAARSNPTPASASETVEVRAGSAQVQGGPVTAASPAKDSADASSAELPLSGRSISGMQTLTKSAATDSSRQDSAYSTKSTKKDVAAYYESPAPRWSLTSDGALQRSLDEGKTWKTVPVAGQVSFQGLAAVSSQVWVGGASGVLYHSSDSGMHWVQIIPTAAGESLTGKITAIEFGDVQNGKVTTSNGEIWTTSDSGKTWQKN